jgi:hypothetical protein
MPKLIAVLFSALAISGCMNLTTRLQPDDLTVKDSHQGEDCVPILLGIGIGTATVEMAMAQAHDIAAKERARQARKYEDRRYRIEPIGKIRRLQFSDYQFLGFGARCIEVTGEASDTVKTSAK